VGTLDAIVLPAISPWDLLGLELHLLDEVAALRSAPTLVVHAMPGRIVWLGRYHLYGGAADRDGIIAMRRLTGGRAVGAGEGWIGIALIMPKLGALLSDRDAHLKPEQVMNRYARGLLSGLRSMGLQCFYPGRDAITHERREIAMCTFETDTSGALLFEAAVAVNRGMEEMTHDLDRIDSDGMVPTTPYGPESSSTLARELTRDIAFDEIARHIVGGHGESFGDPHDRELTEQECAGAARRRKSLQSSDWLRRVAGTDFNRSNRMTAQIGQIEARLAVAGDNRIEAMTLAGDFIANSGAIAELEASLKGSPHDLISVSNAVTRVFATPRNYFLGAGELSNLVRLITNAQ
jgi:lipoate-protein ligase A